MQIDHIRQCAPSRKALALAGHSTVMKKGHRPTARVLVATLADGTDIVHRHVFLACEGEKACIIQRKIQAGATVDMKHWRKADRREF